MALETITVMVHSAIVGPSGTKLKAGKITTLEDSSYVRLLIKSGRVTLIDPPSLEEEYLIRAGIIDKPEEIAEEPVVEKAPIETKDHGFLTKLPKKESKVSAEPAVEKVSVEDNPNEDGVEE